MKHRVWALMTGAIRNEFYLRVMIVKLCDLRSRGIIEGIILSTWKGELDKYDLRNELQLLNINIIETEYIDESTEVKFNQLGYFRQRETIAKGTELVSSECFILRLRTDYNVGIKVIFDFLINNEYDDVKGFGDFPIAFHKKIVMQINSWIHLLFVNDRFFMASKEDMSKLVLPTQNKKVRKCGIFVENEFLLGYAYQYYPLLREIWDIIPIDFYQILNVYCMKIKDAELVLPKIVYRIYATMCVYLYTQVHLLDGWPKKNDSPVHLIDLFKGRIFTNDAIGKIVNGNIFDSKAALAFKDELRKISLNLTEVHGYTFDEYKELKTFAEDKLGFVKIKKCPFISTEVSSLNAVLIDKESAFKILFKDSPNDKMIALINDEMNSLGDVYGKLKNELHEDSPIVKKMICAGVFDADMASLLAYFRMLSINKMEFDRVTWKQALRYLSFRCLSVKTEALVSVYYALTIYNRLCLYEKDVYDSKGVIIRCIERALSKINGVEKRYNTVSANDFVEELVRSLYTDKEKLTECDFVVIEALIIIHPKNNPFSDALLSKLHDVDKKNVEERVKKEYNAPYILEDWIVSKELIGMVSAKDWKSIISYVDKVNGAKDAEYLIRYIWSCYWQNPLQQTQFSSMINLLSGKIKTPNFIVKANNFLATGNLTISREDVVDKLNFIILLEILYRRKCLRRNYDILVNMCFKYADREMFLQTFFRLESDKRLDFFSMKNGHELWMHYVPYLENERSRIFEVAVLGNNRTWPGADRSNSSAFAAYMTLMGNDVFISIEMSAKDNAKVRSIVNAAGYEEKNNQSATIRLLTKRIPIKGEDGLARAVNEAMDEFCRVGEKITTVLNNMNA